jgi:hypothetical protein
MAEGNPEGPTIAGAPSYRLRTQLVLDETSLMCPPRTVCVLLEVCELLSGELALRFTHSCAC